jgi:hypothetical protein
MGTAIHPANVPASTALPAVGATRIQRQTLIQWIWSWLRPVGVALAVMWHVYFRKIDPNERCPGCGHRSGKIQWESELVWPDKTKGAVLHRCAICSAAWGEKPIHKAADWAVNVTESQTRGDSAPFLNTSAPAERIRTVEPPQPAQATGPGQRGTSFR